MMDWHELLSDSRLQRPDAESQEGRSRFQQDLDRIVFSSAFRRLAHKTQVHPLAENDHIHTRLTHSIEVASVGRSLGTLVGTHVAKSLNDPAISPDMFRYIVQAACLAHDIGNPPFGHSGEQTISEWFARYFATPESRRFGLDPKQQNDFIHFDGNAQGFRVLTQLENWKWNGGLQLTYAVLGAFTKYPNSAATHANQHPDYIGCEKIGFFKSEEKYFSDVAISLGLIKRENYWCRHPLAFLL
jgi:dGTPase